MKSATVKPIPPNIETPKRLRFVIPSGIDTNGVCANNQEKLNMPIDLPKKRPKKTANGTCANVSG